MENILAGRRRAKGLSQADLARLAGVTRQAVGAIEAGRVQPGVGVALAIARALDASVEELFGGAGPVIQADIGLPSTSTRRAVVATIGGRTVARPLTDAAAAQPASALVLSVRDGHAELETLASSERIANTVFLSGCEPALGLLASHASAGPTQALWFGTSNREALADFTAGRVHVAALHGSASEVERFSRRMREAPHALYELATIEEGWIVAGGNPRKLHGARDLARSGIRLANRPPGSGARTLLDAELRRAGVNAENIDGYRNVLQSHADVARAIAAGYADVGVGVAAVAEAFNLGFIPLRSERCILAIRQSDRSHIGVSALVATLRSNVFRRDLGAFASYDTTRLGEQL